MEQKIILPFLLMLGTQMPIESRFVYLFSHGIAATHRQAYHFTNWYTTSNEKVINNSHFTLYQPVITFDYRDAWCWTEEEESFADLKKWFRRLVRGNYSQASLAQESDIEQLSGVFQKSIQEIDQVIIQGVSRGASNIITFLAEKQPKNIAAVLIESPFDCIESVMDRLIEISPILKKFLEEYKYFLFKLVFKEYSEKGIRPIDCVHKISKDIPILIICSKEDILVPYESSQRLYQKLKDEGHGKVHLLILEKGNHAFLIKGENAHEYQIVVHAFYKNYNLPHDAHLAHLGKALFESC
jgi:predicted esterase